MAKEQSNKINDLDAFICSHFWGGQNITTLGLDNSEKLG